MPSCAVCTHPQRKQIDSDLLAGQSERAVAGQFAVARSNVQRHKQNHLRAKLKAVEAKDERTVRDEVEALRVRAMDYLDECQRDGSPMTPAMYREVRACLETRGKITGEMPTGSQITVQFFTKLGARDEDEAKALIGLGRALRDAEPEAEKDLEAALEVLASVLRAEPGRRQALAAKLARLIGAEQNDGRPPHEVNNIRNGAVRE